MSLPRLAKCTTESSLGRRHSLIQHLLKDTGTSEYLVTTSVAAWLFNPFTVTISTRGNGESLVAVTLLLVLRCLTAGEVVTCSRSHTAQEQQNKRQGPKASLAGNKRRHQERSRGSSAWSSCGRSVWPRRSLAYLPGHVRSPNTSLSVPVPSLGRCSASRELQAACSAFWQPTLAAHGSSIRTFLRTLLESCKADSQHG